MRQKSAVQGFTLIEMALVLVVVGLCAAAVASGRSLIRAAELRSVIKDIYTFQTAINTFQHRYNLLPGDISNAQLYWPNCTDEIDNPCNGNADNSISPEAAEGLRAWQHLGLSGIYPTQYTGVLDTAYLSEYRPSRFDFLGMTAYAGDKVDVCHNGHVINISVSALDAHLAHGDAVGACPSGEEDNGGEGDEEQEEEGAGQQEDEDADGKFTVGLNVPASKIKPAGYKIDRGNFNRITFAGERAPVLDRAVISPEEAWNIDHKIDDGDAGSGYVTASNGYGDSQCLVDGAYDLAETAIHCQMHFDMR